MRRPSLAWMALVLVLLGLTACSTVPSVPPSPSPSHASPSMPVPSLSASPSGPALGPVVASRSASIAGVAAHLELYEIVRAEQLAYLTFTVRSPEGVRLDQAFGDPASHDYEADGISLIDAEHKKLYLVASHGDGACLCTATGSITLGPNPTVISAVFAAPPDAVSSMDVRVPGFGVFAHVPVV